MDRFVIKKKRNPSGNYKHMQSKKLNSNYQEKTVDEWSIDLINSQDGGLGQIDKVDNNEESKTSPNESQEHLSECLYKGIDLGFPSLKASSLAWRKIQRNNLDLDYTILFPRRIADALVRVLEEELEYFTGNLAKVQIYGKWHDIPRKQATYGDAGLTYRYSGTITPARPWPRPLEAIRDLLTKVTGHGFNFVLVNRYKDGSDKMGEHKDDEKDLDRRAPIASVSLGQPRDFFFKHQDARPPKKMDIDKVNLVLENGSLLLMNAPTNQFWYHALPPRKSANGVRINLTFRKIIRK